LVLVTDKKDGTDVDEVIDTPVGGDCNDTSGNAAVLADDRMPEI
jgi:hypothetical protein